MRTVPEVKNKKKILYDNSNTPPVPLKCIQIAIENPGNCSMLMRFVGIFIQPSLLDVSFKPPYFLLRGLQ